MLLTRCLSVRAILFHWVKFCNLSLMRFLQQQDAFLQYTSSLHNTQARKTQVCCNFFLLTPTSISCTSQLLGVAMLWTNWQSTQPLSFFVHYLLYTSKWTYSLLPVGTWKWFDGPHRKHLIVNLLTETIHYLWHYT